MEATRPIWTEVGVLNGSVTICACFILLVVVLKIVRHLQNPSRANKTEINSKATFGQCRFPDCVRCRRHKDVLMRARTKLTYYDDSQRENPSSPLELLQKDVQASYCKLTQDSSEYSSEDVGLTSQNPLIFRVRGIRAQAVWDSEEFKGLAMLSESAAQIQSELDELLKNSSDEYDSYWKVNDTPAGKWSICHLVDQGVKTPAVTACPETWRVVSSLPGIMTDNLFGNVAFSLVEPGTKIEPHFGPTNVRIRCHLGLRIPTGCELTVGDTTLQWSEGKLLCFDETYLHAVQHRGVGVARAVLLLDLWHPDLDSEQRSLINYSFCPGAVAENG
ncbi:hypothetical protein V1264_021361 [Littorina saxatilis]|uniref:Aspartyl/asparaginy/proline hydroxylase domain-containing protein n=2 Tax=Littorina saxatilis TaxID=31220 RepID=A0AAN9FVH6_9CAEN